MARMAARTFCFTARPSLKLRIPRPDGPSNLNIFSILRSSIEPVGRSVPLLNRLVGRILRVRVGCSVLEWIKGYSNQELMA
jgi:hypothetical protein